jgi:hypothetical protein
MKRVCLPALVFVLSFSAHARGVLAQGAPEPGLKSVTLYGPLKRNHDTGRALYSFKTGGFGADWDLNYGSLYVNDDHDWFEVSAAKGVRTAFRDLGAHEWTEDIEVPVVEPFPVPKEGEKRVVKVDVSCADGADGEDGAPGADGEDGAPGARADGVAGPPPLPKSGIPSRPSPRPARRPKHDGVPEVDPTFARAVAGHVYAVRVVDGDNDFYVLFRVESLVRGDNCTITWKRVPPPQAVSALKK